MDLLASRRRLEICSRKMTRTPDCTRRSREGRQRRAGAWFFVSVCTLLAGCTLGRLESQAPAGVNLSGGWRLDRSVSDDPQKVLEHLRSEVARRFQRYVTQVQEAAPAVRPGSRGGSPAAAETAHEQQVEAAALQRPRGDPLAGSPTLAAITARAAQGDLLFIRQTPDELVLDFGGARRSFVPGQRSVVSAQSGVADQTSGWRGRSFVIELKPQLGPAVVDSYALSADGRHLTEKLHVGGSDFVPAVDLTRVYQPATAEEERALPTND